VSGRAAAQPLLEADDLVRWNHVFGAYFLVLKIGELSIVAGVGDPRDDELLALCRVPTWTSSSARRVF
jgi:hypothetical protein